MTVTQLVLNQTQQQVVDTLRGLPGARTVRIASTIEVLPTGVTISRMEIRGGADGPGWDDVECEVCHQVKEGRNAGYIWLTFTWRNNKFENVNLQRHHRSGRGMPGIGRNPGMRQALDFTQRYAAALQQESEG